MKKLEIIGLVCVWLIAIIVRFYNLNLTAPLTFDQGRDLQVLSEIATGDLKLVGPTTGVEGFLLGPFYYYAIFPGILFADGNPLGVVYWQAFLVATSSILIYFLVKPLAGKKLAWLSLLWITFLPGSIDDARLIWNPSLTNTVLIPSFIFLFSSQKKPWMLALSLFFYGLALQTEFAYAVFLGPVFLWWIFTHSPLKQTLNKKKVRSLYSWKIITISLLFASTTLLPQVIFELKNNFIITRAVTREISDEDRKIPMSVILQTRPRIIASSLENRLFGSAPGASSYLIGVTLIILLLATRRKQPTYQKFLLALSIAPIAGLMLFNGNEGNIFPYYLNPHYLPILLVTILFIKELHTKNLKISFSILFSSIVLSSFLFTAQSIYDHQKLDYTINKQIAALEYTRKNHQQDYYAAEVFTPNLRPVQYQYLTKWLNKTNPENSADFWVNDHQEFFLLYEPHIGDGSKVAFYDWYERVSANATCNYETTIGIVTIRHCLKQNSVK